MYITEPINLHVWPRGHTPAAIGLLAGITGAQVRVGIDDR